MNPLVGRRLQLRPLLESQAELLFEAVDSSRALLRRRLGWAAGADLDSCREFIRAASRAVAAETFGFFETRSGALVGVGAVRARADVPGLADFSLWVRSDRQDRGYAKEAGRLLAANAWRRRSLKKLRVRIDPANRAARKVLRRLGFRYEGRLRREKRLNGRWIDQECWGLLRGEWEG
ncbi:MAG: GNAT family protein [Elusimicrobia bacterium]|nr:GNAT family protein [Elusimicrobiota bacterium]